MPRKPPKQQVRRQKPRKIMQRPKVRAESLQPTRSLQKNEYSTKLYGLMALREICPAMGAKVLDFRVCNGPEEFSMKAFPRPDEGRLIIRTDPMSESHLQTMLDWASQPRLNVYLEEKKPAKTEALVKRWMAGVKRKNPDLRFIAHKVRNLRDYERSVQLNVNLDTGTIYISTTKAGTDKFRDEDSVTAELKINERGRIYRPLGRRIVLPEDLQQRTIAMLGTLIRYTSLRGQKIFEASFVTYREAPDRPEFYDLIFGKEM